MERLVKERLVGAAVLLAAAVILIPEMLSGPKHEEMAAQSAGSSEDAPTKTYTIDLGQPTQRRSSVPTSSEVETTAAPPSEASVPSVTASAPQSTPESAVHQSEPKREQSPPAIAKPAPQAQSEAIKPETSKSEAPKPVAAPESNPPKRESVEPASVSAKPPIASERSVPTSKGWAVQLGSFSKADTAERLAQEVRSKGHNAFVMPVKSGSGTLYRVRVGPMQDRSAADALQRQLKGENPNAAVVPHP